MIEQIPDADSVYRFVAISQMEDPSAKRPNLSMFAPRQGEDGLSVDWSARTTPEETLIRVGRTYKFGTTLFKNPREFEVYGLPVGAVRGMGLTVSHNPILHEPEEPGKPNNPAHALIQATSEVEFQSKRKQLRDLAA